MLSRNDWGPVALNLLLSSILYSLLLFEINISRIQKSILIVFFSILIVFNKLDGITILFSILLTSSISNIFISFLSFLKSDISRIKVCICNLALELFLFIPSISLFLFRYYSIKDNISHLNKIEAKPSIISFFTNSTKSILNPFTLDQYFYGVSNPKIHFPF